MRRFYAVLAAGLWLLASENLWADILEIRGRGYVNGQILSDDGKKIEFKNNYGQVEVLQKSEVMFYEKESPRTAAPAGRLSGYFEEAKGALRRSIKDLMEQYPEWVQKIKDLGKQVGHSAASRPANKS